jgi:hypothetical protein
MFARGVKAPKWSGLYSVQEPNREGLASCAADSAEPAPSANFGNSVLTDCCAARNIRATTHNATSPHALLPPPPLPPPPPLRPLACVHDEAADRLKNGAARQVNNSLLYLRVLCSLTLVQFINWRGRQLRVELPAKKVFWSCKRLKLRSVSIFKLRSRIRA